MRAAAASRPDGAPERLRRNEPRGAGACRGLRLPARSRWWHSCSQALDSHPGPARPARHWPSRHGTETVNVSSALRARCFLVSAGPAAPASATAADRKRPASTVFASRLR